MSTVYCIIGWDVYCCYCVLQKEDEEEDDNSNGQGERRMHVSSTSDFQYFFKPVLKAHRNTFVITDYNYCYGITCLYEEEYA